MDMMIEMCDPNHVAQLVQELTGPYRTIGNKVAREDMHAPAWWHGEEDAYESVEALVTQGPFRRG
jgi:hypothetical protein